MNKHTKHKIIPTLRFPEFENDLEWEECEIGQKVDLLSGYAFQSVFFSNIGKKLLTPKNFTKDGFPNFNTENTKFTSERPDKKYVCKDGDLMLLLTDLTSSCELLGKPLLLSKKDGELLLNQRIVKILPKTNINILFLFYFFLTEGYHKRIKDTASGSTVRHSSNSIILNTHVSLPSVEEQQKIAECLSSLDELIQTQSQKLDTLKTHKKGLMQQLFPAEGETLPKLRFPEFLGDGEWEVAMLRDKGISIFVNEKMPLKGIKLETYLSTENILADYRGITKASKLPPSGSFTKFKKEDILISNIRPYLKKVWFASFDGAASNDVIVIRPDLNVNGLFLSFLLINDTFIDYVMQSAKGVKMPRGDKSMIEEYSITFPAKKEQQKIAECLSSLDEQIEAQSQKIAGLKLHKKGLMQQLFPSINETN